MATITPPLFPIIYVRGYAASQAVVEDTVADPYMGFNVGATKARQLWTGDVERNYFESPLVRLMKEFDYRDVYEGGEELPPDLAIGPQSVFIYRYYDEVSAQLGPGVRGEIENYAVGLAKLILRARDRVCGQDDAARTAFRVYLVAHSMGGLICRCLLQNHELGNGEDRARAAEARGLVDKVFTYATPHNGIDLRLIGNVPGFFSRNNADNFNRERMRAYLALPDGRDEDPVSSLNGRFDPDRFFCLVGTNDRDYEVAGGWARRVVGPMSDGLVRIANATVHGPGPGGEMRQAPRAFVHRSHSGHYGIVNSEDGYQNLIRFLYGDVRVDGILEVTSLTLPKEVREAHEGGRSIRASYHFDVTVRVRGERGWELHRRDVQHGSSVFRRFDEMFRPEREGLAGPRHPHLFSAFLSQGRRVKKRRRSLGFSIQLTVHVPEYTIAGRFWGDDHHDGGALYRDKINLEAVPPTDARPAWRIKYGFDSRTPNETRTFVDGVRTQEGLEFRLPIRQPSRPGIEAELVLRARPWNDWHEE